MDQYTQSAILTSNPKKLIQMLYERAVEMIGMSISEIEDSEARNSFLVRAEEIILYLNSILNMEKGGEISKNLRALYDFIYRQLVDGNINSDVKKLKLSRDLIQELLDTWKKASMRTEVQPTSKSGFSVSA